ncbi:MAG TPA: cytochrome C [Planctomycetaceae bacterium]|nr:cytochrome C [Planctomycetaceae bacterium]
MRLAASKNPQLRSRPAGARLDELDELDQLEQDASKNSQLLNKENSNTQPNRSHGSESLLPPPNKTNAQNQNQKQPSTPDAWNLLGPQATGNASSNGNNDLLGSGTSLLNPSTSADDPLGGLEQIGPPSTKKPKLPPGGGPGDGQTKPEPGIVDPHAELFLQSQYPSALSCAKCHPKHYDEWRFSSHAYSTISPMFQRFEQAMQDLTRGTVGSFCFRCHAPVATQLEVPPHTTILDAPQVIREGITCVACHRVNESYWLTHGDRRIEPGNEYAPMYGTSDGQGVHSAASRATELKLKLSPDQKGPGQPLHTHGGFFEQLTKSDFCATCHQVAVHPGIWLEIVHAQFRAGPAHARGVTCQDCHMGAVPGKADGYEHDYCAIINDKPFGQPRRHGNHSFWGPGYSMAHPGLFPHNKDANRYTPRQWLAFEYRNGWGTPEFERTVTPEMKFPKPWDTKDDRIDGRKVIDANLAKLQEKRAIAALTLSAGGTVEGPFMDVKPPRVLRSLKFTYKVSNISDGHNLPTGSLGAQPQMWLNAVLVGPDGRRIWETGYLDSNGDLADLNSVEVAEHRLPRDSQLFNLQTKFLVNNVRGTDREAPVPVNFSVDQNPFLRPGAVPVSVLNHPPLIRMEAHSIGPLDHRMARFVVPGELITQPGEYRLSVRMRSRPEPPYFMRLVKASPEMIRRLNENIIDFAMSSKTFRVYEK